MKGPSLLIVLGMIAHTTAFAQSVGNYAPVTRTTGITYTSISGTGNSFSSWRNGANADDNRSAPTPIGFTFYYDGQAATQFSIATNGFIDFSSSTANGDGTSAYSRANGQFSTSNGTLLALGPLYDDLLAPAGGSLAGNFKYLTTGTPGSRVLTVEWISLDLFNVAAADLNFQVHLYEATGVIEMIYGSVTAGGAGYTYTCGINGTSMSGAPSAAELLTQQAANTATFSNTPQNALATVPATNTRLTFTPVQNVTPAAPTNITFTSVTQTGMTVGWTDDSISENYFVVSRSTDDVTYTPVGTVTSTTTGGTGTTYSIAQSGLTPGVTYYFRITANNEASAPSGNLSGNQATSAAGEVTSAASGNWNATTTWSGGAVPTGLDNVTIADGHTVTIDLGGGTCLNLKVQGPSGVLEFETGGARTLTVGQNATINSGGTLQTGAAGTVTTHVLSVAGNLTNKGTLDFSTNANTAGADITFTGAGNATFSGTGATTDLRTLTVNKGTSSANTLELMPSNLTVQGVTTDVAAFLTLTNGTLKVSGTFAMTNRLFPTAGYTIGATTGFWLNNPSFTVAAQTGSPTVTGLLRISTGTYNVGTASNNSIAFSTGSSIIVEGGTVNVAGRWGVGSSGNTITYNQSGGVLNLNTVGNAVASPATFDMGTSSTSSVTMSGGTIVLRLAGMNATGPRDYRNSAGIQSITGGTLQLGDGSSGAAKVFLLTGSIPNLVITNTSAGHTGQLAAQINVFLNTTISSNAILNLNGFMFIQIGATLTNNGTINGTTVASRLYFLGTGSLAKLGDMSPPVLADGPELPINLSDEARALAVAQTYTGAGAVTAPLSGLSIENPAGVTIDLGIPSNIITLRVSLLRGTLINTSKVTLGNAGTTSGITQIGAPGLTSPGGNYDGSPVFNHGTGGYIILYAQEGVARTTGFEIPGTRTAKLMTIDNTNGVTLAGGGFSLTTGLTLTNGLFTTSAGNVLTLANSIGTPPAGSATSYVNGPLAIELNVAGPTNRTYAIGKTGAFRPLILKAVNTGGVSQTYTAEVIGSPSGGTPVAPLQALDPVRYWTVSNTANLNATARVNLAFGADDAVPILSSARVAQANTSGGSYTSIGGTTTGTPSAGTVESTVNHTPGDNFFTIGFQDLPYTWDAGGADDNWSNPLNWNFDSVPGATNNVALSVGSPISIDVDGNFAVNDLSIGDNVTLTLLSTNTLTVNGSYSQSGSTVILTAGTLEVRGAFTRTGGTFNAGTGTTLFSGAAAQAIGGGVTHYNLVLRNGGAGLAKILTVGNTFTVANDLTVESTAQLALSAATATTMSVAGNLAYSGITGGANIGSLTFSLTGSGKTIAGAPSLKAPAPLVAPDPAKIQLVEVNLRTAPAKALSGKLADGEKSAPVLENTYEKRRAEVEKLLASTDPEARLVINFDDMTIVRNPASFAALGLPPSTFEMAVTVATGGNYTLADNIAIATGKLITVTGKLNCATFTISGAGGVSVGSGAPPNGTLGIGVAAGGVGVTVLTTGVNTYSDAGIEYGATGDQTIHTPSHPASAMMYTGGSGTKTLDGSKTITGNSGAALTKGALMVGAGTTFADGGFILSYTTLSFANVIVDGTYVSTGSGGISYESGPFLSNIRAVDGTTFGNLAMNFTSSTSTIDMNAAGPVNVSFPNITFGGTAGIGTAGGTLRLNETGTTNVTVTGDVNIAPATVTNTGGGFGGFASTVGTVVVRGNLTTTSTNATQPIMNNTGTNTLAMGGTAAQAFTVGASTTMFTGSTLKIDNANGVTLGAGPLSYRIGGILNLTSGNVTTGVNTLAITSTGSVARTSGHVVGFLSKNVALGAAMRNFEIGAASVYTPVVVAFGTVTMAGDLTATTTDGEHPNIGISGLDSASDVNRYYALTNAGIAFDTYDGTFTFDPTDVDNGADPSLFVVRKYDAPNWSSPAVGTRTATSTQATGMTSFSEFAIGGLPAITISDASVIEGDGGTVTADFTVSVSAIAGQTITVDYETADSTATAGSGDYVAIPPVQTLTFNPNDPLTQTVSVTVNGDVIAEADELFLVNLSNATNAALADAQGVGAIGNDDSVAITIDNVAVTEGNPEPGVGGSLATFTVTLSNASKQVVTVGYETADSTATASSGDYVAISPAQTLTFDPGDPLTQQLSVTVNGDLTTEPDEKFLVNLSNATNATLADAQGVGTILNDDGAPRITIDDVAVTEGNGEPGAALATFTMTLSNASKQVVTVDYATADSTATASSGDYVAISPPQTQTFNPGDPLTQEVSVTVNGDLTTELDEKFLVNLSNATNAIILDAQGIGTILNDDETTTVEDPGAAPVVETFVGANFPNPFAGETTIPIGLKQAGHVRMRVYDARGQLVRILVDESMAAGVRRVRWDGLNRHGVRLPSGFYVVRIEAGGKVLSRPLEIVR